MITTIGLKPSPPSLPLVLLSFFLGAVIGRTCQLALQLSARVLAFGCGIGALLWTLLLSKTALQIGDAAFLLGPINDARFLRGWFTILPFVSPFLCSLALLAFALLARSRPLLKTAT